MSEFVEWSFWIWNSVRHAMGFGFERGICHKGDPTSTQIARREIRTGIVQYSDGRGGWIGYQSFHWKNFQKE